MGAKAQWCRRIRTDKPRLRRRVAAAASWRVLAVLCLGAGTACFQETNPTVLFDSGTRLYHQGEFAAAQQKAVLGRREFQSQPYSEWFWKFTLLPSEIDLWKGKPTQAEKLLAAAPPAQFEKVAIRYRILQSWFLYRKEKAAAAESQLKAAAAQAQAMGAWDLEADA